MNKKSFFNSTYIFLSQTVHTMFELKICPTHNVMERGRFYSTDCDFKPAVCYLGLLIVACAAAKRAIGTRKGEQDT